MLSQPHIEQMAERLKAAAPSGSEVLLFGSYASGTANADSDVDFLVIEPSVPNRHGEMVRLRQTLKGMSVGIDILVISRQAFSMWSQLPTSIYHRIRTEGRSLGHAA